MENGYKFRFHHRMDVMNIYIYIYIYIYISFNVARYGFTVVHYLTTIPYIEIHLSSICCSFSEWIWWWYKYAAHNNRCIDPEIFVLKMTKKYTLTPAFLVIYFDYYIYLFLHICCLFKGIVLYVITIKVRWELLLPLRLWSPLLMLQVLIFEHLISQRHFVFKITKKDNRKLALLVVNFSNYDICPCVYCCLFKDIVLHLITVKVRRQLLIQLRLWILLLLQQVLIFYHFSTRDFLCRLTPSQF